MVMTVFPRAGAGAQFSDAVVCRFRLRPARIAATGPHARFAVGPVGEELIFDCTFSVPGDDASVHDTLAQECTCTTPAGSTVAATVNDRAGGSGEGLRLFAGLASDPFIFQIESIMETLTTGKMAFGKHTTNTMDGANVLGLVLEIDHQRWLGGSSLLANGIVLGLLLALGEGRLGAPRAETLTRRERLGDAAHALGDRVERAIT